MSSSLTGNPGQGITGPGFLMQTGSVSHASDIVIVSQNIPLRTKVVECSVSRIRGGSPCGCAYVQFVITSLGSCSMHIR